MHEDDAVDADSDERRLYRGVETWLAATPVSSVP